MPELNSIQQELEQAREQQRLNIPAKRIKEKIDTIPSDIERLQRRWFWELLQNASDYNDEVEVKLELYPDRIVFMHNGKPFRPIDTENLIAPDSGKDDVETRAEDTIGQFGTGFISTHVLSSHITVSGLIKSEHREEYHKFQFTLDRSGFTDKELLKNAITLSSQESNRSLKEDIYLPGSYDTVFTYDLNRNLPGIYPGQAVAAGLEYVFDVLPYTLAFMPKIKRVKIINSNTNYVEYKECEFLPQLDQDKFSCLIKTKSNSIEIESELRREFRLINEGYATLIVKVENNRILPYPSKFTKLFCSLPMIGTEDFSCPIAINSAKFVPKTERNGIRLTSNDSLNREILSTATIAYKNLVSKLILEDFDGFYNITNWSYFNGSDNEREWFLEYVIGPIKYHLSSNAVVRTQSGRISMEQLKMPYFNKEDLKKDKLDVFYDLCAEFIPTLVPCKSDFPKWFDNIDFNVFKTSKFELKDLLKQVEEFKNIHKLTERINNPSDWLVKLIDLTLIIDASLLDQYKIIPNQLGDFVYRKDDINYDNELDVNLIEIYDSLKDVSYKAVLLDKRFEQINNLLPLSKTKAEIELCKAIDDAFSEISENERSGFKFQSALTLMFKWLASCEMDDSILRERFKWFTPKKPQLFLETIPDYDRDKVLSLAQSGQLASLVKIIESKLPESDLALLTNNATELVNLAKLMDDVVGGFEKLTEYAEILKKDDEDFKFKLHIGEQVERAFKEALAANGLNSSVINIKHLGIGSHDFEITNVVNNKKFYIELKSFVAGKTDTLHLAPSQAEFGASNPTNYALVAIARPASIESVTVEYIKLNAIAKTQLRDLVSKGLNDYYKYNQISSDRNLYLVLREAIRLNVALSDVKFMHLSFDRLIERIYTEIQ
jgi:hypothetical protein